MKKKLNHMMCQKQQKIQFSKTNKKDCLRLIIVESKFRYNRILKERT